jgi:hypothetical protein
LLICCQTKSKKTKLWQPPLLPSELKCIGRSRLITRDYCTLQHKKTYHATTLDGIKPISTTCASCACVSFSLRHACIIFFFRSGETHSSVRSLTSVTSYVVIQQPKRIPWYSLVTWTGIHRSK